MFELTLSKQQLLTPLLTLAGAVDKKNALAILSNILLKQTETHLFLTATDLEIEITGSILCTGNQGTGAITVPAKKMLDIIRSLDDDANPTIMFKDQTVCIRVGRSQFKLATLPAENYPNTDEEQNDVEFTLERMAFIRLLLSTHFAMSQQDVRVFLNGLLLEIEPDALTAVATDGHRMAINRLPFATNAQHHRLLLPRKGVQEMLRLLNSVSDEKILILAGKAHFKIVTQQYTFLTKLIEARFPSYAKAIPMHQDKQVYIDCEVLKRALSRIIILAHEKSKAVLLHLQEGQLTLIANNQEQEEAIETISTKTEGEPLKIGINASYLLDVINHISQGLVCMSFSNQDSSILVESVEDENYRYVIMPMKI